MAPSPFAVLPRWRALGFGSLLALGAPALAAPAHGAEPPVLVTIQDQPRFEQARSTPRADGGFEIEAVLVDDTGAPIEGASVDAALSSRTSTLEACQPGSARAARQALRTGAAGRVCARVPGSTPEGTVSLTFAGDALHLPATASVVLRPAPPPFGLSFDGASIELGLDEPTLRLRLGLSGAAADEPPPTLELELLERDRRISLATTDLRRAGDTLSLLIDTRQLGAPGPARLVARASGRAGAARADARAEAVALKVASVQLDVELMDSAPAEPTLSVRARSNAGEPPSGWIEATGEGSAPLASVPVEQGRALLALGSAAGAITLRYRPEEPWWLPGEPVEVVLPGGAEPAGAPRRWPWLALLAPIGYVCLRSLQRPAQRELRRQPPRRPRPEAPVMAPPAPVSGWVGSVSDAHDGQPIAGALVQVLLPSFLGERGASAHTTIADARGAFRLPPLQDPLPEGARLRIWAPLHSELERPLPPQGRVDVALTSRRRAVLRRLVRWARAFGSPWARGGEPTPGEIAAMAVRRGEARTARWAEGVQAAAYGHADVDEAVEASLRAAEPPWREGPHDGERHRDD